MDIKYSGSTGEMYSKLHDLRYVGEDGTYSVAVKCVDIVRNANGEDSPLDIT